jgi:type VI secretion system protein ImpJ
VFLRLFDLALKMLDRLLAERFVEIPLTLQHDFLLGRLRDPALFQHRFFVSASGPYTPDQIREHVPRMMKVSSVNGIARLINSAVPGARLMPDDYPPAALPLKKGVLFFRLEPSAEEWNEIVATGSIAIHFPFEGFEIAVYAVDPRML